MDSINLDENCVKSEISSFYITLLPFVIIKPNEFFNSVNISWIDPYYDSLCFPAYEIHHQTVPSKKQPFSFSGTFSGRDLEKT